MRAVILALFTAASAALSGCGGGDVLPGGAPASASVAPASSPASAPVSGPTTSIAAGSPTGLYFGSTSTGRTLHAVVLESGAYWFFYSALANPSALGGVGHGQLTASNGAAESNDFTDYNFEGAGITQGMASASYFQKQFIRGSVLLPASTLSFNANYDIAYEAFSSLATVAGTYTGTAAVIGGSEPATVTVSSSGAVVGQSLSGCRFVGIASPHSGWVYDLSLTFAGPPCANGNHTVTGVGYYEAGPGRLYAAGLDGPSGNGFVFLGQR